MEITSHLADPFDYWIIDGFLPENQAITLSNEFPTSDDPDWFVYDSPLEKKRAMNSWYRFPPATYKFFSYLVSRDFTNFLSALTSTPNIISDTGLHGGGWHMQGQNDMLNVHLDYSLHPKLDLQRKFNLIYYLTPDWENAWGGNLEFWSHDLDKDNPLACQTVIENKFNRAVIFDASQNSWHGFYDPIQCPKNQYRKSIASYYLIDPRPGISDRRRARYSQSPQQIDDENIKNLIEQRAKL